MTYRRNGNYWSVFRKCKSFSVLGDTETIADSIMTNLPSYNLEALDPLRDKEEDEIGPVISSILHLRFSESAPDELRHRSFGKLTDVFEGMSEFSADFTGETPAMKEVRRKENRAEFGEVARSTSADPELTKTFARPLILVEPKVKFDDDRDPTMVTGPGMVRVYWCSQTAAECDQRLYTWLGFSVLRSWLSHKCVLRVY